MPQLSRRNVEHAQHAIERLLPDSKKRQKFINILCEAISFADSINSSNWSLRLETSGKELNFNVGECSCIKLVLNIKTEIQLMCDRTTLHLIPDIDTLPVRFAGAKKNSNGNWKLHYGTTRHDTPILFTNSHLKTINGIHCEFETDNNSMNYIDSFIRSNRDFMRAAITTKLKPNSREAHSRGAVDYIFSAYNKVVEQSEPELSDVSDTEEKHLERAFRLNSEERLAALKYADPKPKQVVIQQTVFLRNQLVVAEALVRANGYCEQCKQAAPFLRSKDGTPYLEVHHKIRLADGGDDTIENVIALCPNCHRKAHHG